MCYTSAGYDRWHGFLPAVWDRCPSEIDGTATFIVILLRNAVASSNRHGLCSCDKCHVSNSRSYACFFRLSAVHMFGATSSRCSTKYVNNSLRINIEELCPTTNSEPIQLTHNTYVHEAQSTLLQEPLRIQISDYFRYISEILKNFRYI